MKEEKVIYIFLGILILFLFILLVFSIIGAINSLTYEVVGEERYKCIDEKGGEFVDEYCTKELQCGKIKFMNNDKCRRYGK